MNKPKLRQIDHGYHCADCNAPIPAPGNANKHKAVRCLICKRVHKVNMERIRRLKAKGPAERQRIKQASAVSKPHKKKVDTKKQKR